MNIGIVGHEAAKFTPEQEVEVRTLIWDILSIGAATKMVSGGCHLGGVDIWAEEVADSMSIPKSIHLPKTRSWESGFKPRNIKIAEESDEVHCIVVTKLPSTYKGMRFPDCYHCHTTAHIKSGGCWTALYAKKLGKPAIWRLI